MWTLFWRLYSQALFQVWSCAPRFQRPKKKDLQDANGNWKKVEYRMMLGHCYVYNEADDFTDSRRVVPLDQPGEPIFFGR